MQKKIMPMEQLDGFIRTNQDKISRLIGKDLSNLSQIKKELNKTKKKSKKLYEITKDLVKIIDLYDEKNKININRKDFTDEFLSSMGEFFTKEKINDYKSVFKILINETLEFDSQNWDKYYSTIQDSVDSQVENEIDKNILYSLDFEDLTPKNLMDIYKNNMNDEMIEGGTISFQSNTQEMVGIVNEFIISKGALETKSYLEQGRNKEFSISELLKEVNAASLVEPFTFKEDGKPSFKRASGGQFDGFILEKNAASVILATKSENTNIENDSIFRHFVTSMLIKKKIDDTPALPQIMNMKKDAWISHYTSKENTGKFIEGLLAKKRSEKIKRNMKLNYKDYYIRESFVDAFNEAYNNANHNGHYQMKISTVGNERISKDARIALFGRDASSNSGIMRINMDDADIIHDKLNEIKKEKEKYKEALRDRVEKKLSNKKFVEQIELDTKKDLMVKNSGYLSIKDMISDYNRNTKKALMELGIFEQYENMDEFGYDEMEKLKTLADDLNVNLVYFGSVSEKKSAPKNEYDQDFTSSEYKNKEYRYGLNILAYANILSSAPKDNFEITTDASISFIEKIQLRAVTKKRNEGFDLDLNKINNDSFLKDVVYVTYKSMYESKTIKDDSIDFFDNLLNATNVLLSDFLQDYEVDLEDNPNKKIEDSFKETMQYLTDRNDDFDLINTVSSLKQSIKEHANKNKSNPALIENVNTKLNEIIKKSDREEMKNILKEYPSKESQKNKGSRRIRRRTSP